MRSHKAWMNIVTDINYHRNTAAKQPSTKPNQRHVWLALDFSITVYQIKAEFNWWREVSHAGARTMETNFQSHILRHSEGCLDPNL